MVFTDADLANGGPHILLANPAFCELTGYTTEELTGQTFKMLQGPATDRELMRELKECLVEGRFFLGNTINYRKDGSAYAVEWNISPVYDENGEICNYVSAQRDITSRVTSERERDMLANALNHAHDAVMITDADEIIVFVNPAFEDLTGYLSTEIVGRKSDVLHCGGNPPDFLNEMRDALARGESFRETFHYRRKDGHTFFVDQSTAPLVGADCTIRHHVNIAKDVSDVVQQQRYLEELASTDRLTGLLNRHAGEAALDEAHELAVRSGRPYSVIMGDIDHFKGVNDSLGHQEGDSVLLEVARILVETKRSTDSVVRWGGEEFLVILPECSLTDASKVAERMRLETQLQTTSAPGLEAVTMSLGVAQWQPGDHELGLLARADAALYRAKRRGRNRVEFGTASRLVAAVR